MILQDVLADVKACAYQAGMMMKASEASEIILKGDSANIVTDMDVKIQNFIIDELQRILPSAGVLAEEGVSQIDKEYYWIIDPIDGTTNYAYDYHHSAVSIALIHKGEGVLGVCYNPYLDEMFYGTLDHGAYLNDKKIHVSDHSMKDSLIICGTSPYYKERADETFNTMKQLFLACRDIRRSGSAVLDLCYIAAGRSDGFYEQILSPWDHAAACIIIKEAGGNVSALQGEYTYDKPIGIIASGKENFQELCKLIQNK